MKMQETSMTNKEKALLEVMNSKELSDESKLYIVQNLRDTNDTPEPKNESQNLSDDCWPDIKPRPFNPEASFGDFPTMNDAMEALKKSCDISDSLANPKK